MKFFLENKDIYIYEPETFHETIIVIKEKENDYYEFTLMENIRNRNLIKMKDINFNKEYILNDFMQKGKGLTITTKEGTIEEFGYRKEWLTMFYNQ